MDLLTDEQRERMLQNGRDDSEARDLKPVVKLFYPAGAATWLLTELDPEQPNLAFGLSDLGMGCPELGYVNLQELRDFRGRFGLGIERDLYFEADYPLSVYARAARNAGRITESESDLKAALETY